jgi:purine-binding chemotaxis protein CheW
MQTTLEPPTEAASKEIALAGKYLTFVLGAESYGIPVLKVREIISLLRITPVPQMPEYVKGVINLRGKVIPVIDLRVKFQLPDPAFTDNTCIVVVQMQLGHAETKQIGLIVDAVEEVANIAQTDIEPAPDFGGTLEVEYILGMAKIKGHVKGLLDIDRVVSADTIRRMDAASHTTPNL